MDYSATMQQMYDRINAGDFDGMSALIADTFVEHEVQPGLEPNKNGVIAFFRMFRAAFPDLHMQVLELLPSADKVVARLRATGTHQGTFMGMPATGKSIDVTLIDITRFGEGGLALEHWGISDTMTLMQQLGAVPA
jgi:steroid delta-isomerase-like uncharacterized protein